MFAQFRYLTTVGHICFHSLLLFSFFFLISFSSVTALSYHPDPKFQDCTMRHNILTMSQAFAFPLPVGWAAIAGGSLSIDSTISRPMNFAITVASLWLACSCGVYAPKFAFGYDLYSVPLKFIVTMVNTITAIVAFLSWKKSLPTRQKTISLQEVVKSIVTLGSSLWGICSFGLLFFTILPIVSPYPMATVPTILGKRLSRPASAFTFLGSVCTYILHRFKERSNETNNNNNNNEKEGSPSSSSSLLKIRKGLLIGSSFHVTLLVLKLIGVDGGGLILPGRGLWEVYPAMLAVPLATASSIAVHVLVCIAAVMN